LIKNGQRLGKTVRPSAICGLYEDIALLIINVPLGVDFALPSGKLLLTPGALDFLRKL
jgi:hypothetical protein